MIQKWQHEKFPLQQEIFFAKKLIDKIYFENFILQNFLLLNF